MRFSSYKKNSFLFIFLILLFSCNYKPLFDKDQLGRFNFKNVETNGDKRIAQMVVNKLNIAKDRAGPLTLYIDGKKSVDVSNKSSTGKILEYSITLSYQVEIKNNLNEKIIYSKKIGKTENYKAASTHSQTLSSEKKVIDNISSLVAKQILNEISLVLRNDI